MAEARRDATEEPIGTPSGDAQGELGIPSPRGHEVGAPPPDAPPPDPLAEAMEAAGIGCWELDVRTGLITLDDRLAELFGYGSGSREETTAAFDARVHPDDTERVRRELQAAVDLAGDIRSSYRIVMPTGEVRWIEGRGRALQEHGEVRRIVGTACDTTPEHDAAGRVARVLETMPAGFLAVDRDQRVTYCNGLLARTLGRRRSQLRGRPVGEVLGGPAGVVLATVCAEAMGTGEQATAEMQGTPPLAGWWEVRAWPVPDGLSLYLVDVTERHVAAELADRAMVRALLLSEATSALTGTPDATTAAGELARVLVPSLADCCFVSLLDDGSGPVWRRLREVGWWHADPELRTAARLYSEQRADSYNPGSLAVRALDGPIRLERSALDHIAAALGPGPGLDHIRVLDPHAALVLPLIGRERPLGVLTLLRGRESGPFSDDDAAMAADVASRAGLALDAARLAYQQRVLAEDLQRSMLTAPPRLPDLQIAVRYTSAAEAARVGGDWYDSFQQPGGETMLVIGDVVGHDSAAAGSMGQVRGLLRGIAATTGDGPAAVLGRLDAAMHLLSVGITATAVVARISRTPTGTVAFGWSNAGHPPPLVLEESGQVRFLEAEPDLLLGIDPRTDRSVREIGLPPGATVLLYTDGLIERRGQDLDAGLEELRRSVGRHLEVGLDQLCDAVLKDLIPDRPEDDVALIAVRIA